MSTLETQYQNYLNSHPDSKFTFEEWRKEVLEPSAKRIMEHMEALKEIQKMTQKIIEDERKKRQE